MCHNLSISWRTLELFPIFGHYECSLLKCSGTHNSYVNISFHFSWVNKGIARSYCKCVLNFIRDCQTVFQSAVPFCFLTSNVWEFQLLYILITIWYYFFPLLILAILIGVWWCSNPTSRDLSQGCSGKKVKRCTYKAIQYSFVITKDWKQPKCPSIEN